MADLLNSCRRLLEEYLKCQGREYLRLEWQEKVWRKIIEQEEGGKIGLLEAPTAAGKTEAAVMPYFGQFLVDEWTIAPAMIYVLPNKTLIRKQYERLKNIAKVVEDFLRKQGKNIEIYLNQDMGGITHDKSFLVGDVVVTTLDSFLYGYLGSRSLGNRITIPAGLISTAYIVMDEVHLYQDEYYYTPSVLNVILKQFKEMGIPMLFISATVPRVLKKEIFEFIDDKKGLLDWNENVPTCSRGKVNVEVIKKRVEDFIKDGKMSLKDLSNGKVLIVVNTVERAVKVFELLKKLYASSSEDVRIELVHSRLIEKTRTEREYSLAEAKIIVTTQVAESGLDMENVRLLVTEKAPPDALIQRLGRCARRIHEAGIAYIVETPESSPYPPELLEDVNVLNSKRKDLEEALTYLDKAQELIEECYKRWEPKFSKKLESDLKSLKSYLEEWLGLARVSFEQRIRPSLYITLVLLEREVGPDDYVKTKELVGRTFNLEWRGRKGKYPFLKQFKENFLELEWDPEKSAYRVRFTSNIQPLSIYILDPNYYEYKDGYELGLTKLGEVK
ncbi:MAG: CRISPR-associated helicase Cas3' [Candidatus Brockarchaeota archaeon]|nr:CRISPR-associated helicase Cas3' [Candidatus Brockarchaeota archaeon]